ncbi:MAG: GNAT family N-acetyltransferase [Pseudomonadota bacterium]
MSEAAIEEAQQADAALIDGLADVLLDCVEGGASVSFMLPLERAHARRFWENAVREAQAGRRVLLVARDAAGICGTVQLLLDLPDNQPHRADVAKMLVHRRARRQGLGAALMRSAEDAARSRGRHLLVLDTVTDGDGARLYERLGWIRVGDIPRYALWPGGGYVATTYYYRDLSVAAATSD